MRVCASEPWDRADLATWPCDHLTPGVDCGPKWSSTRPDIASFYSPCCGPLHPRAHVKKHVTPRRDGPGTWEGYQTRRSGGDWVESCGLTGTGVSPLARYEEIEELPHV